MRNGGDVAVIHKVSDDEFDDVLGKLGDSGRACRGVPPKDAPREHPPNPC